MKRWLVNGVIFALVFSSTSLYADKLRVNLGMWAGEMESELQNRMLLDDLVEGAGIGRLNLDWTGKEANTVYPLGLEYITAVGPGNLHIGANYARHTPDYAFNSIYPAGPGVAIVNLNDYYVSNTDVEAGFQFPVIDQQLFLKPLAGVRFHRQKFEYDDLSITGNNILLTLDGPFDATAQSIYAGIGLQFYVNNEFSIIGDYTSSAFFPNTAGSMEHSRLRFGTGGTLLIDDATSDYTYNFDRFMLGVQYDISRDFHIQFGFMNETATTSYPGYFNLPITIVGGNLDLNAIVGEIITDIVFWNADETTEKGSIFFAFNYDFNL